MLADKRLILTGVVTTDSIAYAIADKAQRLGAEILARAITGEILHVDAGYHAMAAGLHPTTTLTGQPEPQPT